ncbi:hypothetical protein ON010_g6698 [Phytophthora cinnamomi]|nr:hypothetical protein ON010_g6698 [Phytophthora cinnamomi]
MRCVVNASATVVELTIPRSNSSDTVIVSCARNGESLSVPGFTGTITCPDPLVVCEVDDPSRIILTEELVGSDGNTGDINVAVGSDDDLGSTSDASLTSGSEPSLGDSGGTSNSTNHGSTSSGSRTQATTATIATGTTTNGATEERLTSLWIVLGGTWLASLLQH